MKALKGHFDGRHVVLDEPAQLQPNSPVTILPAASERAAAPDEQMSAEQEFDRLSRKWREDTGAESSLSRITGNMSYLRIISLGWKAVPLILRELEREPAPWFLALRAITGEENVGREQPGNFRRSAEAWLTWGRDRGYV